MGVRLSNQPARCRRSQWNRGQGRPRHGGRRGVPPRRAVRQLRALQPPRARHPARQRAGVPCAQHRRVRDGCQRLRAAVRAHVRRDRAVRGAPAGAGARRGGAASCRSASAPAASWPRWPAATPSPTGCGACCPEEVAEFLGPHDIMAVPGIGPATSAVLRDMGVNRVEQLLRQPAQPAAPGVRHWHGQPGRGAAVQPRPARARGQGQGPGAEQGTGNREQWGGRLCPPTVLVSAAPVPPTMPLA